MTRAEEIQNRCDELKRENGDDRFFTGREIKMLPEVLSQDERLISLCSGLTQGSTWLIVLTDRRIVLLDKGMFWGMKEISIDLNKVNSITQKAGFFFAKIIIGDGSAGYEIDNVAKRPRGPSPRRRTRPSRRCGPEAAAAPPTTIARPSSSASRRSAHRER